MSASISDQDLEGRNVFSISQVPTICIDQLGETMLGRVDGDPYSGTLTFATFLERVCDVLEGCKFRQDESCVAKLSKFMKLKSPVLSYADNHSDWPLWSSQIMNDIERLGEGEIQLPIVAVQQALNNRRNVVLVGVSGSGKSRTCYDICRRSDRYCLYLDWANHPDLGSLIDSLAQLEIPRKFFTSPQTDSFRNQVKVLTMQMMLGRLIVLKLKLTDPDDPFTPDDFFQFQQYNSRNRSDCVHSKINELVKQLPRNVIIEKYNELILWATKTTGNKLCVVLDEVHVLLEVLDGAFHSSTEPSVNQDTGKYVAPRSYFSFIASFMRHYSIQTVWAGTHLRIGDISRIFSARAASTDDGPFVFKDFNFLHSSLIRRLLDEWVAVDIDEKLKTRISSELQGRPRLFIGFIALLAQSKDCDDPVCDGSALCELFEQYLYRITYDETFIGSFYNFWMNARHMDIREFVKRTPKDPPNISVMALLEEILAGNWLIDTSRENQFYLYESLVSTALVMLGPVNGEPGLICEPAVVKAGQRFFRNQMRRDAPSDTILNRFIVGHVDACTRGRAVETLCVIRLRECFWLNEGFSHYFPNELTEQISRGWGTTPPLGVHDCRTGVANHTEKLRNCFLNPLASHVVLTQERQGAADVVFSYFSFHIKTKWTSGNGAKLVVGDTLSNANMDTIRNTWYGDELLTERTRKSPWVCVRFEFPTNAELGRLDVSEMVQRDNLKSTITASIDSEFTRLFFGDDFVTRYKQLICA